MQAPSRNSEAGAATPGNHIVAIWQRFDKVEEKLDRLLYCLHVIEAKSDRQWRLSETEALTPAGPGDLLPGLGGELEKLAAGARSVADVRQQAFEREGPSTGGELLTAAKLDSIMDQMLALGDQIEAVPAQSNAELAVKALAIMELVEEKSDDIVHRLAASLARDILNRAAAMTPTD